MSEPGHVAVVRGARPPLGGRVASRLVRGYQRLVRGRPSPCRFVPSCSNYAVQVFEDRGLLRGGGLAARRLLRCNPWGPAGWDPAPAPGRARRNGAGA